MSDEPKASASAATAAAVVLPIPSTISIPTAAESASPTKLSVELESLLAHADGKPVTFQCIVDVMAERAHTMLILLLSLPFIFPIPTLGMSAPGGVIVMFVAVFLMVGLKPWLPGFLLRREIPYPTLESIIRRTLKLLNRVEWMFKPRLRVLTWPGARNIAGVALFIAGFILALPLPLPFANAVPALAIVLLGAGLLERDGAFVLAGYAVTLGACAYLYAFWEVAWAVMIQILHWLNVL